MDNWKQMGRDGKPTSVVSDGDTVRTFRSNTEWRLLPLSVAVRCAWATVATDNEMFVASGFRLLSVLI